MQRRNFALYQAEHKFKLRLKAPWKFLRCTKLILSINWNEGYSYFNLSITIYVIFTAKSIHLCFWNDLSLYINNAVDTIWNQYERVMSEFLMMWTRSVALMKLLCCDQETTLAWLARFSSFVPWATTSSRSTFHLVW